MTLLAIIPKGRNGVHVDLRIEKPTRKQRFIIFTIFYITFVISA